MCSGCFSFIQFAVVGPKLFSIMFQIRQNWNVGSFYHLHTTGIFPLLWTTLCPSVLLLFDWKWYDFGTKSCWKMACVWVNTPDKKCCYFQRVWIFFCMTVSANRCAFGNDLIPNLAMANLSEAAEFQDCQLISPFNSKSAQHTGQKVVLLCLWASSYL